MTRRRITYPDKVKDDKEITAFEKEFTAENAATERNRVEFRYYDSDSPPG